MSELPREPVEAIEPFGVRDWCSTSKPRGDDYATLAAAARSTQDSIVAAAAPQEVLGEFSGRWPQTPTGRFGRRG